MAGSARARARRRRRRVTALGAGLAVIAAGTATAVAETGGDGPQYRLASVGRGSVVGTVESSGTVSASSKTSAAFAVSGTVDAVRVRVGERVSKGQVLAKLDDTSLQDDVDSARSALASAKQRLADGRVGPGVERGVDHADQRRVDEQQLGRAVDRVRHRRRAVPPRPRRTRSRSCMRRRPR